MNNTLKISLNDEQGEYAYVSLEDKDNTYIIKETYVDKRYRGQGKAGELMKKVIEKAEVDKHRIAATCSYGISYFEKNPHQLYDKDKSILKEEVCHL